MQTFFLLLFLLVSCVTPNPYREKSVESEHGAVVAAHPLASAAGLKILKAGGNAIDAALASSFAISVLRPQSSGIGGGGFALIYKKDQDKVFAYDFRERAPLKAKVSTFINKDGTVKNFTYKNEVVGRASYYGHLSVGVPGLIAGLLDLHAKHGTLPLDQIMEPAISLAENGFPVYPSLSRRINEQLPYLKHFPESRNTFLVDGKAPKPGHILVQKELAKTLRLIAARGKDIFYKGEIADAIVAEMKEAGGLLTKEDFHKYKMIEREPIEGNYRSYKVVGMPPPSSGGVHIIEILNMLSSDPIGTWNHKSSPYLHLLTEVMRRAFVDRAFYLGDPAFSKVPVKGLINKDYALNLRKTIDMEKATVSETLHGGNPVRYESPSTTHISVVDSWGNAVSTTQTVNYIFGSCVTVRGIVLNNEMDDFSIKHGVANIFGLIGNSANTVEPGKTMLSSMSPTLVFDKDHKLKWVLGSPGGPYIITATLQTLINLMDFKLPLNEAVQAGRIHHQWEPDELVVEVGQFPDSVLEDLKTKGHKLKITEDTIGDIQSIEVTDKNTVIGVSDKRSDGIPMGW